MHLVGILHSLIYQLVGVGGDIPADWLIDFSEFILEWVNKARFGQGHLLTLCLQILARSIPLILLVKFDVPKLIHYFLLMLRVLSILTSM